MPRLPFRNPGPRLANIVSYDIDDEVFLEIIKPWTADHYKEKLGFPLFNKRIKKIKEDLRSRLFVLQDSYCAYCGIDLWIAKEYHREHIIPQSEDANYIFEPENIVMACYDCNDFKGTKKTADQNTGLYRTTTTVILHPYRDDFGAYIVAFYENGGLFFELADGVSDVRALNTLDKLGLQEPSLIKERGMRIRNAILPCTNEEDQLIRNACAIGNRKNN